MILNINHELLSTETCQKSHKQSFFDCSKKLFSIITKALKNDLVQDFSGEQKKRYSCYY